MGLPKSLGRYEILEELGRGSMGVVYKARDPRIGRIVALKTIAFSFALGPGEEEEFLQRFHHEAQIAGRLNHPNVVTIYDVGEKAADGEAYIAMEFVTGTNLHDLLAGGARLPLAQVASLVTQVAEALDFAHDNGVVHRDIKPANILITESGQAKILDFGIARLEAAGMTRPGRFFGTPNYMAPEQVTGADVDGRADQFSLGVTLYQLLTGEKPFVGESVTAISYQVVNVEAPPPSKLNTALRSSFDIVVARALAKRPTDRYARCSDLAEDLRAAVTETLDANVRSTPRTLVSKGDATGAAGASAGLSFLPRLSRWLAPAGPSLSLGWIVFLLCLAALATAPYLMFSRAPARARGDGPFGLVTATLSDGGPLPPAAAAQPPSEQAFPSAAPESVKSAQLRLTMQHRFASGRVVVRVDGREALAEPLRGDGGRKTWVRTIPVESGHRRIEVRVTSPEGSYDDIGGLGGEFHAKHTKTIAVSFGGLSKRLRLRFETPAQGKGE
jgi:serine/threonine-protein kinase